jgi:predicted dehydrogenase
MALTRFGLVGTGWRGELFLRIAKALPDRFAASGVVTRTAARGAEIEATWGVPTFRTVAELVAAERPDFVVVSVPRAAAPDITTDLVRREVPVLTETPPAADDAALRTLWAAVGDTGLVQVAEQYLMQPVHAARWAVARGGAIGEVTSVQVSSTHMYHAVSIIRGMLDVGFAEAEVSARTFTAPLANPVNRGGWVGGSEPREAVTTLATIDFGRGRSGLYDFTENQWRNPLRSNRMVVRGSLGELVDDRMVRLVDPATAIESPLVRRQTGLEGNLEGFDLDHIALDGRVVYRNPFPGARLSDEDIAVATAMDRMAGWCRGEGEPPYPLADGCQDHLVAMAIQESACTGRPVRTKPEPWAGFT